MRSMVEGAVRGTGPLRLASLPTSLAPRGRSRSFGQSTSSRGRLFGDQHCMRSAKRVEPRGNPAIGSTLFA